MLAPVILLSVASLCAPLFAKDKKTAPAQSGNEVVDITGQAISDRKSVATMLGADPDTDLIIVDVRVVPKGENQIQVSLDDFTLISRKDGQRSQPMVPSQIAGQGTMVVATTTHGTPTGISTANRGPIWGGAPGSGDRPRRIGGDDEAITSGSVGETKATIRNDKKENPLLQVLKDKILPQARTNDPVSGFLYFIFDGKHKVKDLELLYQSPAGRLILDFER